MIVGRQEDVTEAVLVEAATAERQPAELHPAVHRGSEHRTQSTQEMMTMGYVKNAWYVASWSKELAPDVPLGVKILGERIVLWRGADGAPHALADRCVHRLAALSLGRIEGSDLRCMYHGLLFDPAGKVVAIPGQELIPAKAEVRVYPVLDRHGWIWVWMGDRAKADEALIPTVFGVDDPKWQLLTGELGYDAEARLINDNLTDFSHLAFVHANSFGANESFAASPWKITPLPRGVRFERWALNQPPIGRPDLPDRKDAWMAYEYSVPGILHLVTQVFPAGAGQRFGHAAPPPDAEGALVGYSAQAVTPVEQGKSRYLFSTGFRRPMPEEILRFRLEVTLKAFAEDKRMIEAQQKVINDDPGHPIMATSADKGVVLFNRLVERLSQDESEPVT